MFREKRAHWWTGDTIFNLILLLQAISRFSKQWVLLTLLRSPKHRNHSQIRHKAEAHHTHIHVQHPEADLHWLSSGFPLHTNTYSSYSFQFYYFSPVTQLPSPNSSILLKIHMGWTIYTTSLLTHCSTYFTGAQ